MLGSKKFSASPGEPILLVNNQKTIINYIPVPRQTPTQAYANVQPYKPKELLLAPIDQRSWGHYRFFVQVPDWMNQEASLNPPIVTLNTANQIYWQGSCYKILTSESWQKTNGFVKYECLKDFQNSPNIITPPTSWANGIALCDIISEFFTTQGQPLLDGQIFLMNSNYTPEDLTSFLIVVQLNKIEAFGFGGVPTKKDSSTLSTETVTQSTKEYYTIEIVSSDGSAMDAVPLVSLALQGERDYVSKKQVEVGFNLADVSDATNLSGVTGGTICTRFRINVALLSSRTAIISGIKTYSTANLSVWFNPLN
jgi:hypothetical protein